MNDIFAGNQSAISVLNHAVEGNKHHHAYLIYGEAGLGKKTFATLCAKAFLCNSQGKKPCGVCRSCIKMENHTHPDFQMIVGEKKGSIHVEQVRHIRKDCIIKPNDGLLKIYLIANVQNMTEEAFNAFLKTLEEPSQHTVFLLTAEHVDQLPETVVSRVFPIMLYPVSSEEGAVWLQKRFPQLSLEDCYHSIQRCNGNLGKAIEKADSPEYAEIKNQLFILYNALATKREYDLLKVFSVYEKNKEKQILLLAELLGVLRDALLGRNEKVDVKFQSVFSKKQLILMIDLVEKIRAKLATNANSSIVSAYCCSEIMNIIE